MAGPEKEGYLFAFPHLKIGLHKQVFSFFYPWWHTLITKLGKKKGLFFSSSRVSGNITLVTDPFLVWDLVSLILYLWHVPSVCHANSSSQECLEFRICYLFLCVLTYFRKCRKICLLMATDSTHDAVARAGKDDISSGLMSSVGSKCHQWSCEGPRHLSGVQCYGWRSGPKITRWWKALSEILTLRQIKEDAVIVCRHKSLLFCFWSAEFLKYKNFLNISFLSHRWAYGLHFNSLTKCY